MEKEKYTLFPTFDELEPADQQLVLAAQDALKLSYAPYSSFHVAAALRLEDGSVITGVNQENASSPAGLCAEQVALYRMGISNPGASIACIAIVAMSGNNPELVPVSPCGNCRQVMTEFLHRQSKSYSVIMKWEGSTWLKIKQMEDLMPFSFTAKSR